jgi:hypothetical protein
MQAIWYETPAPAAMDAVVRELSSSWGQPNGPSTEPDIAGSGLWKRVVAWHRAGMNIWLLGDAIVDRVAEAAGNRPSVKPDPLWLRLRIEPRGKSI